jgi:hypothetical protein
VFNRTVGLRDTFAKDVAKDATKDATRQNRSAGNQKNKTLP